VIPPRAAAGAGSPAARPMVIGIDVGGTHTRGVAVAADGAVLARARRAAGNPRTVGAAAARAEIEGILADIRADAPGPVAHLMIGSAGRTDPALPDESRALAHDVGVPAATVDSDARIAHAAAFGTRPGVMVVAGTGSQCLAFGSDGRRVRVGGWGPTFGDEGSAHWIGSRAIREALHALDAEQPNGLVDVLFSFAGVARDLPENVRNARLLDALYRPGTGSEGLARFTARVALHVAELGEAGNSDAAALLQRAGEELAGLAILAADRAGISAVACAGSVLDDNPIVRASFDAVTAEAGLTVVARRWEPVLGAAYLAMVEAGWDAEGPSETWSRLSVRAPGEPA